MKFKLKYRISSSRSDAVEISNYDIISLPRIIIRCIRNLESFRRKLIVKYRYIMIVEIRKLRAVRLLFSEDYSRDKEKKRKEK